MSKKRKYLIQLIRIHDETILDQKTVTIERGTDIAEDDSIACYTCCDGCIPPEPITMLRLDRSK